MADPAPWQLTYASPTPASSQLPWEQQYANVPSLPQQVVTPEGQGIQLGGGDETGYQYAKAGKQPPLTPFQQAAGDAIGEAIPGSPGEFAQMIGEMLTGSVQPITGEDVQTAKNVYDVLQGTPLEDVVPQEKSFDQYDESDWGRLAGKIGMQAVQALPLVAGLRGAPEVGIPSRAEPSVADAIQALNAQPVPEAPQPQPQAPPAQPEIITPSLGDPFHPPETPTSDLPYVGGPQAPVPPAAEAPAGTSNRQNVVTYGEGAIPSGIGADTGQLLDNARADIRSGAVDPYSVLSKTRQSGIANPEEYAALAAEHERLVNDAVAKQKANDPSAPEAVQRATDFANAIQPHKTAASDLFRLMQGELNYDLSTPYGMNEYMKSELGRGITPSEAPKFNKMSEDIRNGESELPKAVARSDARVQRAYAKVADIPMDQAVERVKQMLKDCL